MDNPYQAPTTQTETPTSVKAEKPKAPFWGWIFFGACLAIMIPTQGGAIWGAVGGGVGGICLQISANQKMPVAVRFLICTCITVGLWGGIIALMMAAMKK